MPLHKYLQVRYKAILFHTGFVLIIAGLIMLTPLFVLIEWPEELSEAWSFVTSAGALIGLGFLLRHFFRCKDVDLDVREGGVIVVLSWFIVCLTSAWPFIVQEDLGFSEGIFEAVSGWTTTGLSIVDLDKVSHMILMWRSIMQFAGGAGLAIIMLAAVAGPEGPAMSRAEGKTELLVPNVKQSSKIVLTLYFCYVSVGILAYKLAGLNLFNSINHSFCAVSTGGFSTYAESVRYYNSVAVEAVTLPLMLLGSLHFATAWGLMHGHFQTVTKNGEIRLMLVIIVVAVSLLFVFTTYKSYDSLSLSIRVAVFQTVTALTTTGFTIVAYDVWNPLGFFVVIILMIVGGGTCSTSGGLKQYRIYALYKSLLWDLGKIFSPRRSVVYRTIYLGQKEVVADQAFLRSIGTFFFLYMATLAIGTIVIVTQGHDPMMALFEFASCLSTVGLTAGVTTREASGVVLWTEIVGMFLGRLEILAIVISVVKIGKDSFDLIRPKKAFITADEKSSD